MRYRQFHTLDAFIDNLHKEGFGTIIYSGNKVPCIYVQQSLFDYIIDKCIGKKYVVEVLLNIFYDGRYVFVDIQLEFINLDIEENFLTQGDTSLEFFECLKDSGMLAIIPKNNHHGLNSNIFIIQLPKKERISRAVDIIHSHLNSAIKDEKTT